MSIVSATASLLVWVWISYIILLVLLFSALKRFDNKLLFENTLNYILTIVISITVSFTAMSLKGTPLASADIRGDLLAMVDLAQYAKEHGWSGDLRVNGDFYPPVWTTIVGNVARVLNVNAIEIYKPAELVLLILGPLATLFIWKKITPSWVALVISIFFATTQSYYWKNIPLHLLIPLIIISIKRVSSLESSKKSLIIDHLHGFAIGLLILTYFGNFWWGILFMLALSLVVLFSRNRSFLLRRQTVFYLSAGLILIPPTIGSILELPLLPIYLLFLFFILLNFWIEKNLNLGKIKNILVGVLIPIVYLVAFITFRTNDDWFEGDVASANPTLKMMFSLDGINLIYIILFFLLFILAMRVEWFKNTTTILVGFCVSALIMRYFIASRMQVTNFVDLWPRAGELFSYSFQIIILLTLLAASQFIIELIYSSDFVNVLIKEKTYLMSSIILFLFIIFGAISNSLGDRAYGSMPTRTFNGAWFAHKGCSNPHEDPMLAKVFETRPYIQEYLREKCWNKKWPLVAPLPETKN